MPEPAAAVPIHWGLVAGAILGSPLVVIFVLWFDPGGDRSPKNELPLFSAYNRWAFSWRGLTMAWSALFGASAGRLASRLYEAHRVSTVDALLIALTIGVFVGLYLGRPLAGRRAGDT
jgi:hypothetical protein